MRFFHDHKSLTVYIGRYPHYVIGRLQWDRRSLGFAYFDPPNLYTRTVSKWWSGWHLIDMRED